jgi:hypothetical protein
VAVKVSSNATPAGNISYLTRNPAKVKIISVFAAAKIRWQQKEYGLGVIEKRNP